MFSTFTTYLCYSTCIIASTSEAFTSSITDTASTACYIGKITDKRQTRRRWQFHNVQQQQQRERRQHRPKRNNRPTLATYNPLPTTHYLRPTTYLRAATICYLYTGYCISMSSVRLRGRRSPFPGDTVLCALSSFHPVTMCYTFPTIDTFTFRLLIVDLLSG